MLVLGRVAVMSWWWCCDVLVISVDVMWCCGDGGVMFWWWTLMNIWSGLLSKKMVVRFDFAIGVVCWATFPRITWYISTQYSWLEPDPWLECSSWLHTHVRYRYLQWSTTTLCLAWWPQIIAEMVNVIQLPCCMVARNRIQCTAEPLCPNEFDICRDQKCC